MLQNKEAKREGNSGEFCYGEPSFRKQTIITNCSQNVLHLDRSKRSVRSFGSIHVAYPLIK